MKKKIWGGLLCLLGLQFCSCIGEELPNIEVDITNVTSLQEGVVRTTTQENGITIFVDKNKVDVTHLELAFEVSEDATYRFVTPKATAVNNNAMDPANYEPVNGQVTDFSEVRYLEVTSEDKQWVKVWSILVQPVTTQFPTKFTFDQWKSPDNAKYVIPYETITEDGKTQELEMWATTNNSLGILLAYMFGENLKEDHFGACRTTDTPSGEGYALKLSTWDISLFDPNKPYVSGCMFLGEFDGVEGDPLKGTHFGLPFDKKPVTFKFKYKYNPGTLPSGAADKGLIEAVLYKTDQEVQYLTGYTIKDKKFKNIVAYAEVDPDKQTNGYVSVEMPFTYNQEVDMDDLKDWKYNLALYFASSLDGDAYIGSGQSVLQIDDVEIVCEE